MLIAVPHGFLDDLPSEDQKAIKDVVGRPIQLNAYDEDGRAELEFRDSEGNFHTIWVRPAFIRPAKQSELTFDAVQRLIKKADISSLRRELNAGVDPNLANRFSWTLLMLAAVEGKLNIAELLISRGADVNATNDFGETALSLAAQRGHKRCVRALLANGASVGCHPHGSSLNDWLRSSSGLPQDKIASILDLINAAKSR